MTYVNCDLSYLWPILPMTYVTCDLCHLWPILPVTYLTCDICHCDLSHLWPISLVTYVTVTYITCDLSHLWPISPLASVTVTYVTCDFWFCKLIWTLTLCYIIVKVIRIYYSMSAETYNIPCCNFMLNQVTWRTFIFPMVCLTLNRNFNELKDFFSWNESYYS